MKSFINYKFILLPRLHSKIIINRLSTVNKNAYAANQVVQNNVSPTEPKVSTLFVPGRHAGNIYQMVKPIIDFNYIEENAIENSCKARGIELDMQYFLKIMTEWILKGDKHKSMVKQYEEMQAEVNRYKALDFPEEANAMIAKSTALLDGIRLAKEELYDVEDVVMPLCAKLPNLLDPLAPLVDDFVTIYGKPLKSNSLSHVEIGQNLSLLEFINLSPTAYFLKGPLAELELQLQVYFSDKLQEMQFAPMSCADFVKSFLIEATGLDPYSCDECIPLEKNKTTRIIQNNNLVGGASFQSLCAYLVNMSTSTVTLPFKYYSLGRHYEASNRHTQNPNLFCVVQSSSIHSLILDKPVNGNATFDTMLQDLLTCYEHLKIPFRTVDVAAPRLKCTESRRVQLELWSPSLNDYVPVSYVSQHNDFVSKRLHITYGVQHNVEGHCNIVEGTVVNVPVLLGCLIEKYEDNGTVNFENIFQLFEQ